MLHSLRAGGVPKWLRERSAKPPFSGSNPLAASIFCYRARSRPSPSLCAVRHTVRSTTMDTLFRYFIDYRYLVIFFGTVVEGEVVLIAGGFLVYEGHLNFVAMVSLATLAAIMGDNLFYWLGRNQRMGIRHSWAARLFNFIGEHRLFKGEEFVRRHGGKSVFVVRFLYGLRFAGAMTAGYLGMRFRRFFLFNLIGSFAWAVLLSGMGYLFGRSLGAVAKGVRLAELGLLLVIAGLIAIYILNGAKRKRSGKGPV